ncbi:extracellular globin-E1-like [Toxorhynchites rutilus septentrionalis]|uniref:extracellular globin-E1-like n=1 Tax=Toxorhynchites rutilus septentrionalis TaxID=329112 RepID=UPI00247900AE|nr:extracellular globin-E1-like [Toxorhynchites rutilus septentrionalis]
MDETGLTGKQKVTLLSTWALMKQDLDLHGRNLLLLLFSEHPNFLPYFNFSTDSHSTSLADNQALFAHSMNVILALGALIEHGLKCPKMFQCLLAKLAKNHHRRGVTGGDVKLFGKIMVRYFGEVLGRQAADTLPSAFGTLIDKAAEAFDGFQ